MHLGASRFGILEVAPRQDRDAPQASTRRDVAELRYDVVIGPT
jgi:hypothetical protein